MGAENVMTAWALGPRDKGEILARFMIEAGLREAELGQYRLRLEKQREVKQREQAVAQTWEFKKQINALGEQSPDAAFERVHELVDQVTQSKAELEKVAAPSKSTQTVQEALSKIQQYSKGTGKLDAGQIDRLKELVNKELPLDDLKKAETDRPPALQAPMTKPVNSRQFFERKPIMKH
jgi:hypothetical protein